MICYKNCLNHIIIIILNYYWKINWDRKNSMRQQKLFKNGLEELLQENGIKKFILLKI